MRINLLDSAPTETKVKVTLASGKELDLWIQANIELDTKADCWLFLMLPIAMTLGEDLEINAPISQTALNAFDAAQRELLVAHPIFSPIELKHLGLVVESTPSSNRSVAAFFSGGLDSTYTVETEPDISSLIAVWGFDIPLTNEKHWKLTAELLEQHADEMGKELILVKTNIRDISNGLLEWGRDYHGTGLAGVASALSNHLSKVFISSSHIVETKRWGQFPALSEAFSTEFQIISEHGQLVRSKKAFELGNNPRTKNIRVCYRNIPGLVNCVTCIKCVRTRLEFSLVDAKHRPIGLETKPTLRELMRVKYERNDYLFFLDSVSWARRIGFPKTSLPRVAIAIARLRSIFYYRALKRQMPTQ